MKRLRPYLDHGFLELDINSAERAMRSVAVGRKNYLFVGSQTGGRAAAIAYTLIETAKLNGVDPQRWRAERWHASPTTRSPAWKFSCRGTDQTTRPDRPADA
ncbi:transposase IS66 [Roseivivax marinus]|uniref:Transposase IS66 n=1 Tax=Roseivivax marinus TaxID=1379903 RepID=W4HDK9_9RHOB|nr:transposase IS66 [Roseivivax marinus]